MRQVGEDAEHWLSMGLTCLFRLAKPDLVPVARTDMIGNSAVPDYQATCCFVPAAMRHTLDCRPTGIDPQLLGSRRC